MIGSDTRVTSWQFLKQKFGYSDDQIRPYTFSVAPFLADPKAIQQGYVTSEPFIIEKEGDKPDLVQRFIDASIEGWYSYLNGDPTPGNALIKRDNPEMTDALIAYGIDKMKKYGVVDSGDAKTNGIGAMNEARWRDFFGTMA